MPDSTTKCGCSLVDNITVPTTPVPELLHQNFVASASQVHLIGDTVSTTGVHLSRVEAEISRLRGVLDALAHKRDALESHRKLHISLLAPARSLPSEILSEIFLHCKEPTWFDRHHHHPPSLSQPVVQSRKPRLDKMPLLLGSVCSRWRKVALSTPRLWASFTLTVRPKYLPTDAALAHTWLARSGRCPLSINIASHSTYHNNTMRPLMHELLRYCERWHDLRLSLSFAALQSLFPAKNRLLSLHRLYIVGQLSGPLELFENAPHLRALYLDSKIAPCNVRMAWSQLRFCDMGIRTEDEALDVLQLTPNLEECVVCFPNPNPNPTSPPRPPRAPLAVLRLPRLHRITIRCAGHAPHFFEKLAAPGLRDLSLQLDAPHSPSSTTAAAALTPQLTSFLSRSPLEVLSLTGHLPSVHQILQACSSLVHLDLRHSSLLTTAATAKDFFAAFAYDRDSPPLLPRLRSIVLSYHPHYVDIRAFADAVESRTGLGLGLGGLDPPIAKLERVEIYQQGAYRGSHQSVIVARLRQLRDAGLKIRLLQGRGYEDVL